MTGFALGLAVGLLGCCIVAWRAYSAGFEDGVAEAD